MPVREAKDPTAPPGNSHYGMCGKRRCGNKDGHRLKNRTHREDRLRVPLESHVKAHNKGHNGNCRRGGGGIPFVRARIGGRTAGPPNGPTGTDMPVPSGRETKSIRFPAILALPRRRGYIAAAETLSPSLHFRIEKVPCNWIRPRQTDGRHLRDRPFRRDLSRPYRSPFPRISRHPACARFFATRPPRPRPPGAGPIPQGQPAGSGRLPTAST